MPLNCGVGETLEIPLDCKVIKPLNPERNQSWIFIGRTDAKAETPILWLPRAKSWLIGKDPDAGRDWGQEKKGTTEDEMAGWHHQLNGHEFEQASGDGEGQGRQACCNPWDHKELDMTEWLNNNNMRHRITNYRITSRSETPCIFVSNFPLKWLQNIYTMLSLLKLTLDLKDNKWFMCIVLFHFLNLFNY